MVHLLLRGLAIVEVTLTGMAVEVMMVIMVEEVVVMKVEGEAEVVLMVLVVEEMKVDMVMLLHRLLHLMGEQVEITPHHLTLTVETVNMRQMQFPLQVTILVDLHLTLHLMVVMLVEPDVVVHLVVTVAINETLEVIMGVQLWSLLPR